MKFIRHSSILPILMLSAMPLAAQSALSGPVAGYLFDNSSGMIRPIVGNPGAASLGSGPVIRWAYASVSPNGKMALAIRQPAVRLISDMRRADSSQLLTETPGPVERVIWSGDSTAALLCSPESKQLQRITGLAGAPVVHLPIDLSFLGASSSRPGISPDGRSIAVASGAAGTASVYLLSDDATPPTQIGGFVDPGVTAFSSDGASLFVLDRGAQKIVRLQLASQAIEESFDVSAIPGVQDMLASPDGELLYVAARSTLSAFNLRTGQVAWSQELDVSPDSLTLFSATPLVLNLEYSRTDVSPVWLFDGQTRRPWFVPPGRAYRDARR